MADESLATIAELSARLDWQLDADETRVGLAALEDLSNEARFYGSVSWVSGNVSPPFARTLVLKAAARYMKNVEGYVRSRAGDEAVDWAEIPDIMGTASFTEGEKRDLSLQARPSSLLVSQVYAYGNEGRYESRDNTVPVHGGGRRMRFLSPDDMRRWRY